MSEELERVRKHILDEIMEEIHIDRMLERMRREPDRIVVVTNGNRYVITVEDESQLTARNEAAEAMGVLERWLTDGSKEIDISRTGDVREVLLCEHHGATTAKYGKADSLVEAVLKAGGDDD